MLNFLMNYYSAHNAICIINILVTMIFILGIIFSFKDILKTLKDTIFEEDVVIDNEPKGVIYDDIVVGRTTTYVIWEEEVRFLKESINIITKDYIKAFITKNRVDQTTRLPIYDSDYVTHIDDILSAVMESLSDNYVYRLKFYFYKNPLKDFRLMIKKVYMSEINELKERKIILAREENTKNKQDAIMSIISVLDEAGVQGISTETIEDVLVETRELSEKDIAELRNSSLDSTRSIIQQFEMIQDIAKEKGVDMYAIDNYLKELK